MHYNFGENEKWFRGAAGGAWRGAGEYSCSNNIGLTVKVFHDIVNLLVQVSL